MSIATAGLAAVEGHLTRSIPISSIRVDGKNSPGRTTGPEFEEFCEDVRQHGVLQAVLVRAAGPKSSAGIEWHLIAGHRRLAAAKKAGHQEIPAVVSTLGPEHDEELRLVENLHRQNIHPLDEAEGFARLLSGEGGSMLVKEAIGLTRDSVPDVARQVGRPTRYVYDRIRLTQLVDDAKRLFREGRIELSHAIILARLEPRDQQRALDPEERGALFTHENTLFSDDEEPRESKDPWAGYKTRTAAELQGWVDEHVRAKPDALDPMLFPVTAEELGAAKKVIPITRSYHLQDSAKSKERTFGPQSWKRADGQKGSKTCEYSATGFVVAGPGRNESFAVCSAKDNCRTHWASEQKVKARRAAERAKLEKSAGPALPGKKGGVDHAAAARDGALRKANLEAGKLILNAMLAAAEKTEPVPFVRAIALDALEAGNLRWAIKDMNLAIKGDLKEWIRNGPLDQIQRVISACVADMGSGDSFARALGVDVDGIEKECKKAALDALKKKPQLEEQADDKAPAGQRPRKRGIAKAAR